MMVEYHNMYILQADNQQIIILFTHIFCLFNEDVAVGDLVDEDLDLTLACAKMPRYRLLHYSVSKCKALDG